MGNTICHKINTIFMKEIFKMSNEEKIAMLEEIMDLDEGTLTLDDKLDGIEEWDSLSKLSLIAETKHSFGIVMKAEVLKNFKTVQDICDYLQ